MFVVKHQHAHLLSVKAGAWVGGDNKASVERVVFVCCFGFFESEMKVLRHVICILFAKCGFALSE